MKAIVDILNKTGNRRFFVTLILIIATTALIILKAPPEYVSVMSGAMMMSITFWFAQHKEGPSQ